MLNARIIQKHDTQANWDKATNFIPKIGEIIVYDADDSYSYARVKIGDGVTTVGNLPFVDAGALTEELHPQSPDKQLVTNYNGDPVWEDRTHWQESRLDVVLPEATIPTKTAYLNDYADYTRNLEAGHTYNVICDGVEYQCAPVWSETYYSYTIGNAALSSFGSDTGEPFFINSHMNTMMTIIYFSTEGEHTISINEGMIESTHQLDEKFIPDTIARKSEVDALSDIMVKTVNDLAPDENGNVELPVATDDEIIDMMLENDMLPVIQDTDGSVLVDSDNSILMI